MTLATTKSVIVLGSSRGIWRALATRLAHDGFGIINTACGQAMAVQDDVVNAADIDRLFKKAEDSFGGI